MDLSSLRAEIGCIIYDVTQPYLVVSNLKTISNETRSHQIGIQIRGG